MVDDVVIGGGIAGLALAFRLRRRGREVVVLEAADHPGGLMRTLHRDGVVLERGPQTLQTTPEIVQLVEDLGLMTRVVAPRPEAADRYLLRSGRLFRLPHGPRDLLTTPLLSLPDVARLLAEPLVPRRRAAGPETVAGLAVRRLGPAALPLLDAFVAGVFGGDPRALEAESAFPDLVAWERDAGSLLRGGAQAAAARARRLPPGAPRPMFALRDGNQELVDALAASLDGALRTSTPALTLQRGVRWHVGTPHDEVVAERAWLACPLPVAARLLDAPDLTVPTAPIASISLVYRREEVPSGQRGFGWLAPSAERRDVLGCLWVSDVFPGHAPGRALLRVMVGGARAPELVGLGEERLADHARRVLHEVQGLDAEPVLVDVATYPDGIPQYPLGHAAAVASWQDRWPGLRLVGWGVTGIGVSHTTRATAELARR